MPTLGSLACLAEMAEQALAALTAICKGRKPFLHIMFHASGSHSYYIKTCNSAQQLADRCLIAALLKSF